MARSVVSFVGAVLLGAMIFAACGSNTEDAASEPVADIAAADDSASAGSSTETTEAEAQQISFANDVQPIIEQNCVSCHSDTGPGTTHLIMETVDDVASIADFISLRVSEGQMPPWPLSLIHI